MTRDEAVNYLTINKPYGNAYQGLQEAIDMAIAALRAPAVTGADGETDAAIRRMSHLLELWELAAPNAKLPQSFVLSAEDAIAIHRLIRAARLAIAAPPAAGAPPALVALREKWDNYRLRYPNSWSQERARIDEFVADLDALLGSPAPAPVAPPADGSVMVRVDPVYVEQMRGEGLTGPFSRVQLDERDDVPTLLLSVAPTPTPDTVAYWREVAQELATEIHKLRGLAAPKEPR